MAMPIKRRENDSQALTLVNSYGSSSRIPGVSIPSSAINASHMTQQAPWKAVPVSGATMAP